MIALAKESSFESEENIELSQIDRKIERITRAAISASFVLYPDSSLRSFIDIFSFIVVIIISLYIPFTFAFEVETDESDFKYFEVFMDIWFLIEIFLNFFTGYYEKGHLIMRKKKIMMNYVKTWLAIDLISSIPFSFVQLS